MKLNSVRISFGNQYYVRTEMALVFTDTVSGTANEQITADKVLTVTVSWMKIIAWKYLVCFIRVYIS